MSGSLYKEMFDAIDDIGATKEVLSGGNLEIKYSYHIYLCVLFSDKMHMTVFVRATGCPIDVCWIRDVNKLVNILSINANPLTKLS